MVLSSSTACCLAIFISAGLGIIAPPRAGRRALGLAMTEVTACSLRSGARPSQNWEVLKTAFRTVGTLRPPSEPRSAGDARTPPMEILWHVLQLIVRLSDRRGSK